MPGRREGSLILPRPNMHIFSIYRLPSIHECTSPTGTVIISGLGTRGRLVDCHISRNSEMPSVTIEQGSDPLLLSCK